MNVIKDTIMKKTYWMILAAGMMCLAACHTEQDFLESEQGQEAEMWTEVITATVADDATKATVADGGTFGWVGGTDMIAVHTTTGYVTSTAADATGASANFSVTYPYSSTRDAYAIFPSYLVTPSAANYGQAGHTLDVTLPGTYTLEQVSGTATPCPMIATNTPGAGWAFKQICGLLRLTVTGIPSETRKLTVKFNGMNVSGTFAVQNPATSTPYIESAPYYSSDRETADDVITITSESDIANGTVVNIPLPTRTYSDIVVMAYDAAGNGTMVGITTVGTDATYTVNRAVGKKRSIELDNNKFFSIADKKYAFIAPGNLQYQASMGTWRFATYQYETIGINPGNTTVEGRATQSDWIDLFGWGTSGWEGIGDAEGRFPYSNAYGTQAWRHYGSNRDFSAISQSLVGAYKRGDWGMFNTIGSDQPGTWRTPTGNSSGEWKYLITSRGIENRFVKATVNNVEGLILLPDYYVLESEAFNNMNVKSSAYSGNEFDVDGWNALANKGAIFLPVSAWRNSNDSGNINVSGDRGRYWASTAIEKGTGENYSNGDCLKFWPATVVDAGWDDRSHGFSVRLIRDLN